MSEQLFFVDSHNEAGKWAETGQLLAAIATSAAMNGMKPLARQDFQSHKTGLFVTEGIGYKAPAIAYIAARSILRYGDIQQVYKGAVSHLATIGSLFVLPDFRGRGIASQLIAQITTTLFDEPYSVDACLAIANSKSAPLFAAAGFMLLGDPSVLKPRGNVFILNKPAELGQTGTSV